MARDVRTGLLTKVKEQKRLSKYPLGLKENNLRARLPRYRHLAYNVLVVDMAQKDNQSRICFSPGLVELIPWH